MAIPSIHITGANGFIGSYLVSHYAAKGWKVIAYTRSGSGSFLGEGSVKFKRMVLPDEIVPEDFIGGDYLIHCAIVRHDRTHPESDRQNYRATGKLLEISRGYGFKKFVFFSSMSAHSEAISHYGRHKLELEGLFDPARDVVLRPGLVIGDGGVFKSMANLIAQRRLIPLIGGGGQPLQTLSIIDLAQMLDAILAQDLVGLFLLAEEKPITMERFYRLLALKSGVSRTFIKVPYFPVYCVLTLLEMLGIELPITTENLLGLKRLRSFDTRESIRKIGITPRPLSESLRGMKTLP